MKKLKSVLQIFWLRLTSKTPAFFRAWGVFLAALTASATYLNAEMLNSNLPDGIERKHVLWLNFIVFLFATLTPLLTTKDKQLSEVKTEGQLQAYKDARDLNK
jgi:hypothetical protein